MSVTAAAARANRESFHQNTFYPSAARVNKEKRAAIFERLRAAMPAPSTELEYETPFQLLVAVILSAQATDVSVNKATGKLFEHA